MYKIYQLPVYIDNQEFVDKIFSYLYMRFKFKNIELLEAKDIKKVITDNVDTIMVKLKDKSINPLKKLEDIKPKHIKDIYMPVLINNEETKYIYIRLNKQFKFFETIQDIKGFLKLLAQYFEKALVDLSVPAEQVKEEVKQPIITDKKFYSLETKLIPEAINLPVILEKIEKSIIKSMLSRTKGIKSVAAQKLGITERMIGYKIKKYKL